MSFVFFFLGNIVQTRGREKRGPHVKEQKRQGKVCDVAEPPRKPSRQLLQHYDAVPPPMPAASARPPKPVDEDLYKIPPDLLRTSKRVGPSIFFLIFFGVFII